MRAWNSRTIHARKGRGGESGTSQGAGREGDGFGAGWLRGWGRTMAGLGRETAGFGAG